eukprot:3002920-Rhodomonas_salina.1
MLLQLIESCLTKDAKLRPTSAQVLPYAPATPCPVLTSLAGTGVADRATCYAMVGADTAGYTWCPVLA